MTVAVCTRDRAEDLALCLASLLGLDYPDLDLLVVDNAPSTDATRALVEHFPSVRYEVEPRPGLTRARNRAVDAARGEIIAFTDDDVVVDPGWIRALVRALLEPNVGIVTGLVLPLELETEAQIALEAYGGFSLGGDPKTFHAPPGTPAEPSWAVQFGTGASMAYWIEALRSVGPFDPELGPGTPAVGGEDVEMLYRMLKAGYAYRYEPAALAHHRHRRDFEGLRRQIRSWGTGTVAFLAAAARRFPEDQQRLRRFRRQWFRDQIFRFVGTWFRAPGFPRSLVLAEIKGAIDEMSKERRRARDDRDLGARATPEAG